jgi:hypothetical protein
MKHLSGYGAYMLFLALRTHFTKDNYDFFVMCGKLRANKDSYNRRTDRAFFEKVARDYDAKELRDLFIANLLQDKHYILEFIDEEADEVYTAYKRRRQALSYVCTNDMDRIFNQTDIKRTFSASKDRYPDLITLFLRGVVSIETMVILDDLLGFTSKYDKIYYDDSIWPKISRKISKYRPFLKYDKVKMKDILKGIVNEQRKETKEISAERPSYRAAV